MRKSYLVQRLKKPTTRRNPFAFGGGYLNGGLSEEAAEIVFQLMSFDYMGSAEFEFGALPDAFNMMMRHDLATRTITIDEADVAAPSKINRPIEPIEDHVYDGTLTLIGNDDDLDEIETRVRAWASQDYNSDMKENTNLARALRPVNTWDAQIVGWFELNNGFMVISDQEMAETIKDAYFGDAG